MTEVQYRSGGEAPTYPLFGKFGFQTIFWANRALIAHDRFQHAARVFGIVSRTVSVLWSSNRTDNNKINAPL